MGKIRTCSSSLHFARMKNCRKVRSYWNLNIRAPPLLTFLDPSNTLCSALFLAVHSVYTCSAVCTAMYSYPAPADARLASVLSTNHRRASSYLLCSDWSNRWLEKEKKERRIAMLITSPLNEGAVIKTKHNLIMVFWVFCLAQVWFRERG